MDLDRAAAELAEEYLRFEAARLGHVPGAAAVLDADLKFDPGQLRDAWGRWVRIGGAFPLPDPQAGFIQDAADAPDRMTLRPGLAKLRSKAKVEQALRAGLSAKFGHDVEVDLGRKMHLQTMKEVAEGLLRGAEDWPKARLHKVSAAPRLPGPSPDAWAVTKDGANGVEIMFNERQFGNRSRFLAKLKRTVENGSARPSQDNAAYIAVHEFGHVVDRFSVPKDRQILPAVWAHMDDVGIDPDDDAAVNKYIRDQLGDYTLHSPAEMIAEAFADVQLNGFFDAAPLSRVIVTRLRKYHDDMPGSSQAPGVGRAPAPVVDAPAPPGVPAAPAAPEVPKEIPRQRWGAYHGDLTGLEDIANAVENGKLVKDKSLAGGICGDTRLREYGDGMKVVYKRDTGYIGAGPKHAADAEQLASKLALALGIRAPRIYRNSDDEVHMEYMGDAKVAVDARRKMQLTPIVDSPKGRLVGLLDLMLQNGDRHEKN